jgi:PDDEXK-like domain of unknown function (DUF3799)
MNEKIEFSDGIYTISNEQYHNASAFSRTQLMMLDKSPYHFWHQYISGHGAPREKTEALILGHAIHMLLLEEELFHKTYCIFPKLDRRTKEGKEQYNQFILNNQGKLILTAEYYEKASSIKQCVMRHDIVHTLLKDSIVEQSLIWTDKETGLQFKARPDAITKKMIVDLKTTEDANPYRFKASAFKYGYYLQAAMIREACRALDIPFELFSILAIEKKEPYVPAIFVIKEEAIDFGLNQFNAYKNKLKKCYELNSWNAYPIYELDIPAYAAITEEEL